MKMKLSELRSIIRRVLLEEPGVTSDPTDVKGFYNYDIDRGTDIYGFWYKSPGRSVGGDGDPSRPEDPAEYIGFKTKGATPEDAAEEAEPVDDSAGEETE